MRAPVAWSLTVLTLLLVVADTVVTAQYRPLLSEDAIAVHGFPFIDLAVLGSVAIGVVILGRARRHPIGLLLTLVGVTGALSLLTEAYGVWVLSQGGPGPLVLGSFSGWLSTLLGGRLSISGLALMFLLAPDGRLLSRRWRYAVAVAVLGSVLCVLALLSVDPLHYDLLDPSEGTGSVADLVSSLGFLLISIALLASVASMVVRLHRSRGEVRQQVRLIAVSAALVAAGLATLSVVQGINGGRQTWAASIPLFASYTLLPVLFGIAVLRYRLYDVEVILNRTLVIALGTAFAGVGYTSVVVLVGERVAPDGNGVWLSLLATALVAVAFQPLRRQVVRLASRLAYGSRAKPYEALSDFSRRIAEAPSAQTMLPAVAEAAARAVSARGAAAELHAGGSPDLSANWGERGADERADVVEVRHRGTDLGRIRVWLPGTMRARPSDVRLLEALADQTAVVFQNVALEHELASHVSQLDRTTRDLARSRARIIEADDAARRAMERAITRDVLPHLASLPAGIGRAREANASGRAGTGLDELVGATNTALESLRGLTRGLFPTQLARSGLEPALRTFLARGGLAGALHLEPGLAARRFPAALEAAAYSCCVSAVQEYAQVTSVGLSLVSDELVVVLRGLRRIPSDLSGVVDRAEAAGGSLSVEQDRLALHLPVPVAGPVPG